MPMAGDKARLVDGPLAGFCVDVKAISGGIARYVLPNGLDGTAAVSKLERDQS